MVSSSRHIPRFTSYALTHSCSGKTLTIEAKGNFTETVEDGAYINLQVKYGLIRLINQKADLCEQMKNVDEECPLLGEKIITKDVDLPKEIPPVRNRRHHQKTQPANFRLLSGELHCSGRRVYQG